MIEIYEIQDLDELGCLNAELSGDGTEKDRCFALREGTVSGLGILRLEGVRVKIAFAKVKGGDAALCDLLVRSMLNVLRDMKSITVCAPYDKYYENFGFQKKDGEMVILSDKIKFPKSCGGVKC